MKVIKMRMIDLYNETKIKNIKSIVLIKSGIFYETFNDDAYIMSYLFDYKIKKLSNFVMVGFPEKVVDSVKERLKKEKISYVILKGNKKIESGKNSYNESNYDILFDLSYKTFNIEIEINSIRKKLEILKNTKSIEEILTKIKEII
jgi:hypothetical protein